MTPMQVARNKRQERAKICARMLDLSPPGVKGRLTAESMVEFERLDKEQDELRIEIEMIERADTLQGEMNSRLERKAVSFGKSIDQVVSEDRAISAAFMNYIRRGITNISSEDRELVLGTTGMLFSPGEQRALSVSNSLSGVDLTQGATLIPAGFSDRIVSAEKAYGGMIDDGVCYQFETDTGNEFPVPTDDDTDQAGEYLNENTATDYSSAAQPKFGAVRMQAYVLSSKLALVPIALLQDSAFDLETYLSNKFGTRLGRGANRKFTVGSGASQPMGIVNVATVGQIGAAGQTETVTYGDLVSLKHSVDPAYRRNGRWMFHDTTLKYLKTLYDGVGRPLWQVGIADKAPDTIDGDPYTINQDFPVMADGAKSIAYGDFQKYWIRRVRGMSLIQLRERFAEKFQVGFLAFERNDGDLIDAGTHPIKVYQNAAH